MHKPFFIFLFILIPVLSCSENRPNNKPREIKAAHIIGMLNKGKHVHLHNTIVFGDLDFTQVNNKTVLNSALAQAVIEGSVTFSECIFIGKVTTAGKLKQASVQTVFLQNLSFSACDFRGETSFNQAIVRGNLVFTGSVFRAPVSFNGFYAAGKTSYFSGIKCEQDFNMQDALFIGNTDFFQANFDKQTSFQASRFDGIAQFSSAVFVGKTDFSSTVFNHNVLFNYTRFDAESQFSQLRISGLADFVNTRFNGPAIFKKVVFMGAVRFNKAIFSETSDFSQSVFMLGKPDVTDLSLKQPNALSSTLVNTLTGF